MAVGFDMQICLVRASESSLSLKGNDIISDVLKDVSRESIDERNTLLVQKNIPIES